MSIHNTLQNRERELSVLFGIYQEIQSVLNRVPVERREAGAVLEFSSGFPHTAAIQLCPTIKREDLLTQNI